MDYIRAVGEYFPGVIVSCRGDETVYTNLVWEGGLPLPSEADLAQAHYNTVKYSKILQLSEDARIEIIKYGFISNALGSDYLYDAEEVDQLNLLGSCINALPTPSNPSGSQVYYATRLPTNLTGGMKGPKTYYLHNYEQIRKVMDDGVAFKLNWLMLFNEKRDFINTHNLTLEQLESITLTTSLLSL